MASDLNKQSLAWQRLHPRSENTCILKSKISRLKVSPNIPRSMAKRLISCIILALRDYRVQYLRRGYLLKRAQGRRKSPKELQLKGLNLQHTTARATTPIQCKDQTYSAVKSQQKKSQPKWHQTAVLFKKLFTQVARPHRS